MTKRVSSVRRSTRIASVLLFAAIPLAAQAIPDLYGRFRGDGYFEMRGANDKRDLSEISIDLRPSGALDLTIRGKKVDVRMLGRVTEWTGRHQVHVALDRFDGQATDIDGWIRFDDGGRFERLELDGKQPGRIGVSFAPVGPNLEKARPAAPVVVPPAPAPGISLTEEAGWIRRGTELADFRTGFLRDCVAACRNDDRCEGYTYLTSEARCFTLATVSAGEPNRNATSGVKRATGAGTGGVVNSGFEVRVGTNQTGNTFSDLATPDANTCLSSCAVNSRCRAFTYNQETRTCYLKESIGEFRAMTSHVSGARPN